MKRVFDQWLPAWLLFVLAAFFSSESVKVTGDGLHRFRLIAAAVSVAALAISLWAGKRWARWIALGWSIDVLANIFVALALGAPLRSIPWSSEAFAPCMGAGATLMLLLVGRKVARERFEPGWTTRLHCAYRWTAISVSVCVTHGVVTAQFGIVQGIWGPAFAASLLILALALLSAGKFAGLPVALGAFVAYALRSNLPIPYFPAPAGLRSWAEGSDGWTFFIGGASSVAWAPAIVATLIAHALALQHLSKRHGRRWASVMMMLSVAGGLALGLPALLDQRPRIDHGSSTR